MKRLKTILLSVFLIPSILLGQTENQSDFWELSSNSSILWNIVDGQQYPHGDDIEMSGKKVSAIIHYKIDDKRNLKLDREIIYPQIRTFTKTNEPEWKKYRAYFKINYAQEVEPNITLEESHLVFESVDSIRIKGQLIIYHSPVKGLLLERSLFPSMNERLFIESWRITNITDEDKEISIGNTLYTTSLAGHKGNGTARVYTDAQRQFLMPAGGECIIPIYFSAALEGEPLDGFNFNEERNERNDFLKSMKNNLVLETTNPVLDQLFYFSKIRASESIFDTKMGLVHSPGGGNYYVGVWANDQVEYSGPFFPFLGYDEGIEASKNAYNMFLENIPEDYSPIINSFEMEGDLPCCGKDRGDAAMIAYGASQFALRYANEEYAEKIWPLIEWSINYCIKMKNEHGVVMSTTDEMEGRISTGEANLSTNALFYGGLKNAANLAKEIGRDSLSDLYSQWAVEQAIVIENHFGYELEGLNTYRYFEGNTHLRHWICLPLVMGINKRAQATATALLDKLWTENGVLVELNPDNNVSTSVFWDRGTLYALRGTFKAGFFDKSLNKLIAYSQKRLVQDRVPYPVEAYPENNMRHLSAESALFCRVIIEGILSFEQSGFNTFSITPRLSENLSKLKLSDFHIGDNVISIDLKLKKGKIHTNITVNGKEIYNKKVKIGTTITIKI